MARLGDLCDIRNGYAFKSDKYVNDGVRIIRIANVQKGYIEDTSPVYYSVDDINAQKYALHEGDLLISLTGNVGRVGILTEQFLPAALNQRVANIVVKDNRLLDKSFLFHLLNSDTFENKCIFSANGVAQKNLSTDWLKEVEISLPPIDEQRKIAAVLDKISDLTGKRRSQLDKLDELVKFRFVEMFGDPVHNTLTWQKLTLGECLVSIDNGYSYVCANEARLGNEPAILKLSAVTYGDYHPEENKAILDETLFSDNAEIRSGDLLFTRKNTPALVGMCAYVADTPPKLMMPDLIFRLNTNDKCNKIFLWKLINHETFRPCIEAIATGSAKSMSNISKERLRKMQIIVPDIDRQEQFADFIRVVEKSKSTIRRSLTTLDTLKKSLMQEYFSVR